MTRFDLFFGEFLKFRQPRMLQIMAKPLALPRNRALEGNADGAFSANAGRPGADQAGLVTFQSSLNFTPKKTHTPKKQLTAIQIGR